MSSRRCISDCLSRVLKTYPWQIHPQQPYRQGLRGEGSEACCNSLIVIVRPPASLCPPHDTILQHSTPQSPSTDEFLRSALPSGGCHWHL